VKRSVEPIKGDNKEKFHSYPHVRTKFLVLVLLIQAFLWKIYLFKISSEIKIINYILIVYYFLLQSCGSVRVKVNKQKALQNDSLSLSFFHSHSLSLSLPLHTHKHKYKHLVSISSTFLRTNFSYERCFGSFFYVHVTRKAAETTFVQKNPAKKVWRNWPLLFKCQLLSNFFFSFSKCLFLTKIGHFLGLTFSQNFTTAIFT